MTLYIANSQKPTTLKSKNYDLAVVYKYEKIYDILNSNKILLDETGKIIKEN